MVPLIDPKLPQARKKQKVVVVWGKGRDNKHVRDMWVLDVAKLTDGTLSPWKEVSFKFVLL